MGFFGQAKDMVKLRSEAKKLEKELQNIHIEAEEGAVKITINAKQELVKVELGEGVSGDLHKAERDLIAAFGRASKKAQEVAAEKMKPLMGNMQGLMGSEE